MIPDPFKRKPAWWEQASGFVAMFAVLAAFVTFVQGHVEVAALLGVVCIIGVYIADNAQKR